MEEKEKEKAEEEENINVFFFFILFSLSLTLSFSLFLFSDFKYISVVQTPLLILFSNFLNHNKRAIILLIN
jgi:hypothetical protein